ncbi:hypothetical protein [Limosilactobacillus panis]|uniref:DUF1642 domain-containing protein n=1 Tax=Limosilactobacillus panis TaxID=47493 RepID=A0ABT7VLR2_9LACO|nr:hypothetical protein [Limosilactobacillus panis]MDM8333672.1 hypothetical protein [Limosilactobacillus panis]
MKNENNLKTAKLIINASDKLRDYDWKIIRTKENYNLHLDFIRSVKVPKMDQFEELVDAINNLVPTIVYGSCDEQSDAIADYQTKYQQQIIDFCRDEHWKKVYDLYFEFIAQHDFSGDSLITIPYQVEEYSQVHNGKNSPEYLLFHAFLLWREYRDLNDYYVEE